MPSAVTTYGAAAAAAYDAEEDSVRTVIVGAEVAVPTDQQSILRQLVTLTTTALGAAAVFTGPSVDCIQAARMTGMVYADVAGTLDVQVSDDGTTWYTVSQRVTDTVEAAAASGPIEVAAGAVVTYNLPCTGRYKRLRYTNGAGAQASFRLSAYLAAE
jgi:streptogramin lyase